MDVRELCSKVGKCVTSVRDFGGSHQDLDESRREIGEEFEYIATLEETDIEDFDALLSNPIRLGRYPDGGIRIFAHAQGVLDQAIYMTPDA